MSETSPATAAAAALTGLLERAAQLRAAGREQDAIACGPSILEAYFRAEHGGRPLDRPQARTFTEKLYRRMLDVHDHGCDVYSTLSDKIAVHEFVAKRVGERHLTPLLWTGDDAGGIPWSRLPADCILKCNEGSGKSMALNAGVDRSAVADAAKKWQSESYYWFRREYHYWTVPRRLLVEPRLDDGDPDGPLDFIFFCFDGVPRLLQVGSRTHTLHRFFTPSWEPVALSYRAKPRIAPVDRPRHLDRMLDVAATLSQGFDFVRVDLYACGDDIRFGELTFTPRAGWLPFDPPEWDARLGEWWRYAGLPDG